jgi:large subunit ribosomal protein L24
MSIIKNTTKKIRKGDKVKVIAGNYRGQVGAVMKRDGDKILVQGINMRKKHMKRTQENQKGSIVTIERPIHISNVQLCIGDDTAVKVKVKSDKKGHRSFYYMENDKEVIYRPVKKIPA